MSIPTNVTATRYHSGRYGSHDPKGGYTVPTRKEAEDLRGLGLVTIDGDEPAKSDGATKKQG
jgi:hypothetical protein